MQSAWGGCYYGTEKKNSVPEVRRHEFEMIASSSKLKKSLNHL